MAGFSADLKLECQKPCPKKAGSQSAHRYEAYMHATTVGEYKAFGGSAADLKHDIRKGFVEVFLAAGVAAPARAAVVEDRAAVALDVALALEDAAAGASRSTSTDYCHVLRSPLLLPSPLTGQLEISSELGRRHFRLTWEWFGMRIRPG